MKTAAHLPRDSDLAEQVDALRQTFPETQDLYREVCALLFFRYGITPTANKLYQLVRKGSMSAPAEALARFWANLREKSRVRIEHPDLPTEMAAMAGELVGSLWQRAQTTAEASFADAVAEARETVAQAKEQAARELARAEAAAHALFQLQAEFSATLTRLQDLEHALAKEQGARDAAERQLASAITQRRELQESLAAARRDFDAQLVAQRQLLRDTEDRAQRDSQRRAVETELERQRTSVAEAALEEANRAATADAARNAEVTQTLQREIAHLRQEIGLAEGKQTELRAAQEYLQRQLESTARYGRPASGRGRGRIVRPTGRPPNTSV